MGGFGMDRDRTYLVEVIDGNPDSGSFFPSIFNALGIVIEEPLQLIVGLLLVEVVPFLRGMHTKPVFVGANPLVLVIWKRGSGN